MPSKSITIQGLQNPKIFIPLWEQQYQYGNKTIKDFYKNNIKNPFENKETLIQLFQWKNGITNISESKMKMVNLFLEKIETLESLQEEFSWETFETEFQPQKNGAIWKIFLLHLVDPKRFPIFDQHVYRSYYFFINGEIKEIPKSNKKKWDSYKNDYLNWFQNILKENQLSPRALDKAFFAYGKVLKYLKEIPKEII